MRGYGGGRLDGGYVAWGPWRELAALGSGDRRQGPCKGKSVAMWASREVQEKGQYSRSSWKNLYAVLNEVSLGQPQFGPCLGVQVPQQGRCLVVPSWGAAYQVCRLAPGYSTMITARLRPG